MLLAGIGTLSSNPRHQTRKVVTALKHDAAIRYIKAQRNMLQDINFEVELR
jgi:hypothetical protein